MTELSFGELEKEKLQVAGVFYGGIQLSTRKQEVMMEYNIMTSLDL